MLTRLFQLVTVVAVLQQLSPRAAAFPVSTSLQGLSAEPALLELFKYSRHFGTWATPWDENCTVDPQTGWPTQDDFGVVIDWEPVDSAKMAFSATCNAEPDFSIRDTISVEDPQWDTATRRYTATLATPANCTAPGVSCNLFLSFRNTSGGCSHISLMQNGASAPASPSAPAAFSAIYLAAVENFAHLRMMDWGQTNGNPLEKWSERTPVGWPSYRYGRSVPARGTTTKPTASKTGAPYEVMIDLCNTARVDCWLNVPAMVDEDFITQLAALAKHRLDPKLNLYLEVLICRLAPNIGSYCKYSKNWRPCHQNAIVVLIPKYSSTYSSINLLLVSYFYSIWCHAHPGAQCHTQFVHHDLCNRSKLHLDPVYRTPYTVLERAVEQHVRSDALELQLVQRVGDRRRPAPAQLRE